ncbi:glutathione S-transferase family protein [Tepidamorphus sp. 3E244]|uniref:glutathione S-transferase family protein n=1 Tax=Tepidamorphus sp. 3E244 TaxID=3385498 RepID=UPI0038FCB8A6
MSDLVFYTNPMSRGRIVRWMLEELGESYETRIVTYGAEMKGTGYLAINPMGKVPAVVHKDAVITECAAICAYLADAFPDAKLAPAPGSLERAPYYRWLFFAAGPIEQAVTMNALEFEVPPEKQGTVGFGSMDTLLQTLEDRLKQSDYIAGDEFTAADVYVGAQIGWGMQFGTIEKRPAFETYFGRLASRDAAKRAAEIDDKLTAEMQAAS